MRDHLREKVTIAFPYYDKPEMDFTRTLAMLVKFDANYGKRLPDHGWYLEARTTNIARGRNQIVKAFLDECPSDWLLFTDTDHPLIPNLIELMVASADPVERPILSALVQAKRDGGEITPACVLYDPERPGQLVIPNYIPPEQHWPVAAVGAGIVIIHRTVFETMREPVNEKWFAWQPWGDDGDELGEDYTFCLKALAHGFTSWVDTTIDIGHIKKHTIYARDFFAQHPEAAQARWDAIPAQRAAVIPFKNKWAMTRRLVEQIQGDCDLVLLMNNGSDLEETKRASEFARKHENVTVTDCKGLGIHEMWNAGADIATRSLLKVDIAFLNNDLDAGPGMLPRLSEGLRSDPGLLAVCPNYDGRPGEGVEELQGIHAAGNNDGLAGFAFMVKGEFFEHYRFPEECMWWYGDNDLTLSVTDVGGWYGMVHSATVTHLDGGSQTIGEDYGKSRQGQADLAAFMEKWNATRVES